MAVGQFSPEEFWNKLKNYAVYAGREVVEKALTLYYAAQRPETPVWARLVIFSALAYFILPADAIPDFIPVSGYADDLGTLLAALGAVASCITPEVKQAAKQQADGWFGENAPAATEDGPRQGDSMREISID